MKNNQMLIGVVVVVLVLAVGGFLMRHQLKAILGMGTAAPVEQAANNTNLTAEPPAPVAKTTEVSTVNIYLTKTDKAKGAYMTDFNGMTLYTFDKDVAGVSNCTGNCLKVWPVYTSGATAQGSFPANITVITGSDGKTKQFAWKGMPLYYYASDTKSGDLMGDGVGGIWHIVKM